MEYIFINCFYGLPWAAAVNIIRSARGVWSVWLRDELIHLLRERQNGVWLRYYCCRIFPLNKLNVCVWHPFFITLRKSSLEWKKIRLSLSGQLQRRWVLFQGGVTGLLGMVQYFCLSITVSAELVWRALIRWTVWRWEWLLHLQLPFKEYLYIITCTILLLEISLKQ